MDFYHFLNFYTGMCNGKGGGNVKVSSVQSYLKQNIFLVFV